MWRKNTRNDLGVDLNRNYPYKWKGCSGSSGFVFSETYRGPSAASEPESKAMMKLVGQIKPKYAISYHSYSELVIHPYGCEGEHTPDRNKFETISKELADLLVGDEGGETRYKSGTGWELLYASDGTDLDWMYHEHGVFGFTIEIGSEDTGFQPNYELWRDDMVNRQRPGWQYLLRRMFSERLVNGR